MTARALLFIAWGCLLAGCTAKGGEPMVSHEPEVEARYRVALHTLQKLQELKSDGRDIQPGCRSLKQTFADELKRHPTPEGRRLFKQLEKTCAEKKR